MSGGGSVVVRRQLGAKLRHLRLAAGKDVLDEKHDRAFKGTVIVLLSLEPGGKGTAQVIGGTLNNKEVSDCVISKLNEFEYPQVPQAGTMQYVYRFEPAY